jgi:ubiquinone/menaquinone biosynthesis C-methylase UbiE
MAAIKQDVIEYYEKFWSKFILWYEADKTLGIHLGYYDEKVKNSLDAVFRMNDLVWELLGFSNKQKVKILDAGCGVGGTSIHLAKQHPNATFTGITNVLTHVKLAYQFAKEHQTSSNLEFFEDDYCKTRFPDNHFDGVFALESINYANNKEILIREMYRVLKPGGKLVILDGLKRNEPFNPIIDKIYRVWLAGRALTELEAYDEFAESMYNTGFYQIKINDIAQYVGKSYTRAAAIGFPFLCSAIIKNFFHYKKYEIHQDVDYFMGVIILGGILGLGKLSGYYSITAVKK